jgi:thiol-disulfide isomerase/thioredoxin
MKPVIIRFSAFLASCLLVTGAIADDLSGLTLKSPPGPQPAVIFMGADGNMHPLNPQQHKLSIVHFWASWCIPCIKELPQVDAAAKAYADKDVRVVAISLDTDLGKVITFFAEHNIANLTPYTDMGNASFKASKSKGLPATLFLDSEGKEIARAEGPMDWSDKKVKDVIEGALK